MGEQQRLLVGELMWVIKRNLPNAEDFTRPSFYAAMALARKLSNEVSEVVITNGQETYVLRKLWD